MNFHFIKGAITCLFIGLLSYCIAQEEKMINDFSGSVWDLETDIGDLPANGASIYIGRGIGHHKFFVGSYFSELPAPFNPQQEIYNVKRNYAFVAGYQYFLKKQKKGWHFGLDLHYADRTIAAIESQEEKKQDIVKIGPRIGFNWMPFKAAPIMIVPHYVCRFKIGVESLPFDTVTEDFNENTVNPYFVGLNIGWRFR